ncbi:MAG: type II toxin-antitoxin system VapC family toxin [Candidatus Thermoplasmatota archaeon]|jgi:predicted nucleic acid-binding protein|nr:type II toxin-antitoxin system VapC family toxin [Candidatus Thermoplasmatota archaeon]MCL5785110.1 type II toxin-antitoxin system VapC family toxin [Candidatus Thermoplasmatota archaeon]
MKIIDSSAIVKFFSTEPGWENLREIMNSPITIELSIKELGNALWKKVNQRLFQKESAVEVLTEFQRICKFFDQRKYLKRAFEIAVTHNITIYDSLFIAAAVAENCELVTSDRRQAEISKELDIKTELI